MVEEKDEGLNREELLEFESAKFTTSDIIRAQPIPIPEGIVGPRRRTERVEVRPMFLMHLFPTLLVVAAAIGWTAAGYYRHDVPAYLVGLALTCASIVSGWASALRAF